MDMTCDCKDWAIGMRQIIDAQVLVEIHGVKYTGKPFNFCPWCGKSLRQPKGRAKECFQCGYDCERDIEYKASCPDYKGV